MDLLTQARLAKEASYILGNVGVLKKNEALLLIADYLEKNIDFIISENGKDIENAIKNGIKTTMLDRLKLTDTRIHEMAVGVRQVASLNDPIGEILSMQQRPNGLVIGKKRVPMGLVGIIYEARPNVTVDAVCLTLKTGNATILRGGSEAIHSNLALVKLMKEALKEAGLPENAVELIHDTSRETVVKMMKLNGIIDVLIPRGGAGLIKSILENATIPVIETGTGNCHIYIDETADYKMALNIMINAKCQRPSVCNACESLVIHKNIAEMILPLIKEKLDENNVEMRGCEKTCRIISVNNATEEDFYTEYNDLIISIKIVDTISEGIAHINQYSTKHSESIITQNYENSQKFLKEIDAAAVYVNASTRFTDGFEFGFGAEIGISTQKLHARGPMGLNELTTTKYIIYGNGQIRD